MQKSAPETKAPMWTREMGVQFAQMVEKKLPPEAHCAMGGSVLHRGESNHDLDIFIYPHGAGFERLDLFVDKVVQWLRESANLNLVLTNEGYAGSFIMYHYKTPKGRKVDFFFVNKVAPTRNTQNHEQF